MSNEIHKKLRPGKPEDEQWFHPGRKEFVPFDLTRLDSLIDVDSLSHVAKSWDAEKHLEGDMQLWHGTAYSIFPTGMLAFLGDIDAAQIVFDKCAALVKVHVANDYTSIGWGRAGTVYVQARVNFWPLCRHVETQQFLREEGFVVREGDDKVYTRPCGKMRASWQLQALMRQGTTDSESCLTPSYYEQPDRLGSRCA